MGHSSRANLAGKKVVLLTTYGVETPHGIELVVDMFSDIARWVGMNLEIVRCCTADQPVGMNRDKLEEAYSLGRRLGKKMETYMKE